MSHALSHLDQPYRINFGELQRSVEIVVTAAFGAAAALIINASAIFTKILPSVHAKFKDEIRNSFTSKADIDKGSVGNKPYLLAMLKEALRIHLPVPGNHPRRVGAEGAMVAGNYVPPSTLVSVPHWAGYHSERNWSRPSGFVPEIWIADPEFETDNRACFRPFSHGPRECLGQNLVNAETRVFLARYIYNFDMELVTPEDSFTEGARVRLVWSHRPLVVKIRTTVN